MVFLLIKFLKIQQKTTDALLAQRTQLTQQQTQALFDAQAVFNAQRAQFIRRQREAAEAANKRLQDSINKNKNKFYEQLETSTKGLKPNTRKVDPKPKMQPIKPVTQPVPVTSKNSKPNRLSTTHGGHPHKIGTQQPTYIKKSGGKVTKKYANGGSVRKPKYKG